MPRTDPRVDAYIERARPFARPILLRLRALVHKACPQCEETVRWGFPHFDRDGPVCSMAAFKAHCAFGFWKADLLKDVDGSLERGDRTAMGQLGRIASLGDLPPARALDALIKQAANLNEAGIKVACKPTPPRRVPVPKAFMTALRAVPTALATFEALPPSHRREYIEWIVEAKQESTKARRITTAVQWLSEGKRRNWKYEQSKPRSGTGRSTDAESDQSAPSPRRDSTTKVANPSVSRPQRR